MGGIFQLRGSAKAGRRRAVCSALPFLAMLLASAEALGQVPGGSETSPVDAGPVSGVLVQAQHPDDALREVGAALTSVPREMVDVIFVATGGAAGILEERQVVPRLLEMISPERGEISIFPTAFAETGRPANLGARMIANLGNAATSLRAGFGLPGDLVVASRIQASWSLGVPLTLSLEGRYDFHDDLDYLGVGQTPETDPRNRFLGNKREALYQEQRSRAIVGLGFRAQDDLEVLFSSSLTLRRFDDEGAGTDGIRQVFAESSVPGGIDGVAPLYTEGALRLDTRPDRGGPVEGWLVEAYAGVAKDVRNDHRDFARTGGRVAGYLPIGRSTNILSPKITADSVHRIGNSVIGFSELARQPEFRGPDDRRDDVSVVASLDYRWGFVRYVSARLFADYAVVAPALFDVPWDDGRPAVGFGIDVFSRSTELADIAVAFSPDAVSLHISVGERVGFGDRQHRD